MIGCLGISWQNLQCLPSHKSEQLSCPGIGATFTALCSSFVLVTVGMPPRLWGDSSMNMNILHRLSMTVTSVHLAICPMDSQPRQDKKITSLQQG